MGSAHYMRTLMGLLEMINVLSDVADQLLIKYSFDTVLKKNDSVMGQHANLMKAYD
jgi:hypothetical protein